MRVLEINKKPVYYAQYLGTTDIVDEDGYLTGEKKKSYSDPVKVRINVSVVRGLAERGPMGIAINYKRVMVTDDMDLPINEESVVWVDIEPTEKPNFMVTRVAKSLNHILYEIKEVS